MAFLFVGFVQKSAFFVRINYLTLGPVVYSLRNWIIAS